MESSITPQSTSTEDYLINNDNNNNNKPDDLNAKQLSNSPQLNAHSTDLDNEDSSLSTSSHSDIDKKAQTNSTKFQQYQSSTNTNNTNTNNTTSTNSSRSPSPNTCSSSSLSSSQDLKQQQQSVNQLISLLSATANSASNSATTTTTSDLNAKQPTKLNDLTKLIDVSHKVSQIISSLDNTAANLLLNSLNNKIDLIKETSVLHAASGNTPTSLSPSSSSSSSSSLSSSSNTLAANLTELIQQQVTPLLEQMNLNTNSTASSNATASNLNTFRHQIAAAAAAQVAAAQLKQDLDTTKKSPSSPTQQSSTTSQQQQKMSPTNLNTNATSANYSNILNKDQLVKQAAVASNLKSQLSNLQQMSNTNQAAAAWTNALNAASLQSANTSLLLNQQQQQLQQLQRASASSAQNQPAQATNAHLLRNLNTQLVQQLQQKQTSSTNSKLPNLNTLLAGQSPSSSGSPAATSAQQINQNAGSNTMQQALNSIYSPIIQKAAAAVAAAAAQQQQQQSQLNLNNASNGDENGATTQINDLLNSQLIDLIRQDPTQLENILKFKNLYQMSDDPASLLEGLQQLDQTVPANLAAAAAAAAAAMANSAQVNPNVVTSSQQQQASANSSLANRNSPRSLLNYQNFAQQQLVLSNQLQQQQQQQQQVHQQTASTYHNGHSVNPNTHNNLKLNQPMYPTNQFSLSQQQLHHNYMQMQTLAQQQQQQQQQQQHQALNQFQDYHEERFSRKVFVGGLPPDIDEDEIVTHFRRYGNLIVDWPHKAESKSYFPPKGYAFLIFQEERSVQDLIETCVMDDGKLYMVVSSPSMKDKPVQIRPWCLADSDFVMDGSQPLDPRKTIFVGGVPRPLKAIELAMIMDRFYGGVCYAGIDTDPELKYPKGAGRVAFSNQQSYIAAISARFVQLQHGEIDKRVEVKPYVLDDQMCDECQGTRCGGKFAPFFCANVTCLQYYCEACWATIHTRPGREYHKPLVKEGADRPRPIPYK